MLEGGSREREKEEKRRKRERFNKISGSRFS
jgi:hypothetical protein